MGEEGHEKGVWVQVIARKPLPAHPGPTHGFNKGGMCLWEEVQKRHTCKTPVYCSGEHMKDRDVDVLV